MSMGRASTQLLVFLNTAAGSAVLNYHSHHCSPLSPLNPAEMSGPDRPWVGDRRGEPFLTTPYRIAKEPADWVATGIP